MIEPPGPTGTVVARPSQAPLQNTPGSKELKEPALPIADRTSFGQSNPHLKLEGANQSGQDPGCGTPLNSPHVSHRQTKKYTQEILQEMHALERIAKVFTVRKPDYGMSQLNDRPRNMTHDGEVGESDVSTS